MELSHRQQGPVVWLTLNRPDALNALSRPLLEQLGHRLAQAQEDDTVRVVVLTGAGRAFCAGGDLKGLLQESALRGSEDYLALATRVFARLRNFPKPVIAAVNGLAMAGGLELLLASDIVFAAQSAKIGDAHANYGLIPGAGGAALLPRVVPLNIAKQMLLSGEAMPAEAWKRYGLVNEVFPDETLMEEAQKFAEKLAEKSPLVLRKMKEIANQAAEKTRDDTLRHEMLELRVHLHSHDMHVGLLAFSEKRKPVFKGF